MIRRKIIIIGFGPAGISCAIQLRRLGFQPLVIEKGRPGGMLPNANLIENYPGFPEGITGERLAELFIRQAERFGIKRVDDEITRLDHDGNKFHLTGKSGDYQCSILVLATGTVPKIPEEIPAGLIEKGLIHFDIQQLKNLSGMTIGIIGAGDAAFDYCLSMAEKGNKVLIFNRGDQIKALNALREKVFINKNITYIENIAVKSLEILPSGRLSLHCSSASSNSKYSLDYVIFATGRVPANDLFRDYPAGRLDALIREQRLFLVGDLKNGICRQVSTAVGDGVRAAMDIFQHESHQ